MSEDTGVDTPVAWPTALVAEVRVRKMQTKLHRWAVADHGFRFDDVFNFVCDPAVLVMAFERVAGNTGARTAGVDGVRAADVLASGVTAHLNHIRDQLRAGAFQPLPVRERMIPKTGGKLRRLGIPTVTDRVVQAALKLVLEPVFEADFRPYSYGFRPNRRAHDAIAEIHLFGSQGYRWVLDADIEACFDRIDHTALMGRVRVRVKDKRVLALVKAFLKAGIMTEFGERNDTASGTPQGVRTAPWARNTRCTSQRRKAPSDSCSPAGWASTASRSWWSAASAPSPTSTSSATASHPREAVLFVVGDFDCSGEDVERDWVKRTGCWSRTQRVLFTYDQVIHEYELPATEGKRGDPRWPAFARRYSFDIDHPAQWEVEALEPAELQRLVLAAVDPYVDRTVLAQQIAREEQQRRALAEQVT